MSKSDQSFLWPRRLLTTWTICISLVMGLMISVLSVHALAASSEWQGKPPVQGRLLLAGVAEGQSEFVAGLELTLEPGWKTYWRTPGAAGIKPRLIWQEQSAGIKSIELLYPAPHRLDFQGLQLYGYEKRVIFPLKVTRDLSVAEPDLNLDARILVCRELCIPASVKTGIKLTADNQRPDAEAAFEIDQFKAQIPLPGAVAGLETALFTLDEQQKLLQVELTLPANLTVDDLFPEVLPEPELDAPVIVQQGQRLIAQFSIQRKRMPDIQQSANLVVRTNLGAYEISGQWQALAAPLNKLQPVAVGGDYSLPLILLLALTGGLILNLMPCVLPVLSIKVLHLIRHQEFTRSQIRKSFIATAAGIIASFAILAGVMIALKSAGQVVGWGIQFQQPLFIGALGIIIVLFAANLWGRFEFRLPGFIAGLASGGEVTQQNPVSLSGSFAQGALATLLATPCSAPFLGTAISFAFAQNAPELLMIFVAMGVGLTLPYLLLTLVPEWVHKLPKPGPWMVTLKKVLSIGLLLTAGWLFWVLSDLVVLWGTAVIAAVMLIWWGSVRIRPLFWVLPLVAWLSIALLPAAPLPVLASGETEDTVNWQAFKPESIRQHVSEGKLVFVDITARWCVTCVANKVAVIQTETIQNQLNAVDMVAMQGDWTRPDDTISSFLNEHNRFGIPFNAVYGPAEPEGVLLGEILTQQDVLNAIQKARGH
ncbi:protein-disulfide reductase DsbD family protein [Oceanospirillum sediminis]|uniref:Thioredoxin family protein n=1 Tax=Oceanospirillum sediminis TaxID=2760088 RepID=A0A839IW16_9GAMM|nr:protein-disulfide reductase DsbD domain-containing protein [Oceanospirillum sediminis]MBB1488952.1 thioredoxin family protein [Oceanospirillum sediminis]